MTRNKGFTIIELLVVISVIAILMLMLVPVMGKIREHGRRTRCGSNLNHTGHAVQLYTDDYQGYLPRTKQATVPTNLIWNAGNYGLGQLYPDLLKDKDLEVLYCPSANYYGIDGEKGLKNFPLLPADPGATTYNSFLYRAPNGATYGTEPLEMLEDFRPGMALALDANHESKDKGRHNHGGEYANIVYADAHVEGKRDYGGGSCAGGDKEAIFRKFADKQ